MTAGPPRVVAVADSDSYLKWGAGLMATLPADWLRRTVLLRSPIMPSKVQRRSALHGLADVPVRSLLRLLLELRHRPPDVLLLACTGPVVDVLIDRVVRAAGGGRRPVIVSGLPGLCVPASPRAWRMRAGTDLLVVHSHREVAEFTALGRSLDVTGEVALARLPFLQHRGPQHRSGRRVVFAAQAKVPAQAEQRLAILLALDSLSRARPDLRPVVKLRARSGELQTHREDLPYDGLWADLVSAGRVVDGSVEFVDGPMGVQLTDARGLVTVSSTAALEAMAIGVPVTVLGDFGVDQQTLNLAFAGSGCIGTLDDLAAGRFFAPEAQWLRDNYFHPARDVDWLRRLEVLVSRSRAGRLPRRPLAAGGPGLRRRRRHRWRLAVPPALVPLAGTVVRRCSAATRSVRSAASRRHDQLVPDAQQSGPCA